MQVNVDKIYRNWEHQYWRLPELLEGVEPDRTLQTTSDHLEPSSDHLESLKALAASVRNKGKVLRGVMEEMILKLCQGWFLNRRQLEELLGRSQNTLRVGYLSKMVHSTEGSKQSTATLPCPMNANVLSNG